MKVAVRYYSKSGNTKKLADAIAEALKTEAMDISHEVNGEVDVLFMGSSVYWAGMDKKVKEFVAGLDKKKVKLIVNFSTAAIASSTYGQMQKLAKEKGLHLSEKEFHCKGSFKTMHRGKPDEQDIKAVKKFALQAVKEAEHGKSI